MVETASTSDPKAAEPRSRKPKPANWIDQESITIKLDNRFKPHAAAAIEKMEALGFYNPTPQQVIMFICNSSK